MKANVRFWLTSLIICGALAGQAEAQRLTLQLPAVARFAVNTTVSVPDRGSALLGSVGRSSGGRKDFGPIPSGSSYGRSLSHHSLRQHVWIHDFAAMDPFYKRPPKRYVETAQDRLDRKHRAVQAYLRLAEKADKRGKSELARRYRAKAAEYTQRLNAGGR